MRLSQFCLWVSGVLIGFSVTFCLFRLGVIPVPTVNPEKVEGEHQRWEWRHDSATPDQVLLFVTRHGSWEQRGVWRLDQSQYYSLRYSGYWEPSNPPDYVGQPTKFQREYDAQHAAKALMPFSIERE